MTKQVFETLFAFIFLLLFSPIILIAIIFTAVTSSSLGLFTQMRIGQYGRPFIIYKIQTMKCNKVTRVGRILRKTKVDELPQLLNILKGEMSFVGPRPDVPGYYDKLTGNDSKVLMLKPGLTSLAAIKYRNEEQLLAQQSEPLKYNDMIIFPDKIKMNLEYLEKRSFFYDLKIILLTVKSLFK